MTRAFVIETLGRHGIASDRLELLAHTRGYREHLDVYGQIDIALDPFPYNGTTTTCEALAMGVPVVTLAGRTHAGRVGVSLLNALGEPGWVAGSEQEYWRIAAELAADVRRLAEIRRNLRGRMASVLCDEARFTRRLENAYRTLWRSWCAS